MFFVYGSIKNISLICLWLTKGHIHPIAITFNLDFSIHSFSKLFCEVNYENL